MKKEIADMWVAALRSGDYKQGKGVLGRTLPDGSEEYCCLGVLCDLAVLETTDMVSVTEASTGIKRFNYQTETLPVLVQKWAKIATPAGRIPFMASLAEMNDAGTPFTEIADLIEKHWKDL